MGYFFSILIVVILILVISIYKKNDIVKKKKLSDEEILKNMENGFVQGVLQENTDVLKEREKSAIEDVFKPEKKDSNSNISNGKKNRKFYEGDINWKFTDTNDNLDCWTGWDYMKKKNNVSDEDISIKNNILKTYKRSDGRTWCPVDKATSEKERRELDKPPSLMDIVNDKTGNVWGLVGAVGLGLTEELITKAIEKSTMKSMERAAKKISEETSEKLMKKIGKEFYEESGEKLFKESGEKLTKEALERSSRESLERLSKETEERALKQLNTSIRSKLNSKFIQETKERIGRELKQNLIDKYSKKTLNSLKDDIVKKVGQILSGKTATINSKALVSALKAKMYATVREVSIKSAAKSLNATIQKKIISKVSMQIQKVISISLYKNIMKGVASSISNYISKKIARVVLMKALLKAQIVITAKAFFRSQAKAFLNFGRAIASTPDDIAKMMAKLVLLSRTMTKESLKAGVKSGLKSAAKMASKLKPGPLAIFDILSFALDTIDPLKYNNFMPTKKYIEAVDLSNKDRKELILTEMKKLPHYKDMQAEDIPYPSVMDPLDQIKAEELEKSIGRKIGQLFALSSMGETHKSLKPYVDKMNADLASGKLTPEELAKEDPDENSDHNKKMKTYYDLIDTDAVISVINIDNCRKLNGLVYGGDKCTYKKEDCDKLYKWPLDEKDTAERKDEIYTEFVVDYNGEGKCLQANPEIRKICETMDATWDVKTNSCDLGANYCLKKGGTWIKDSKECEIGAAQQIFEFILGTTVTRLGATVVNATQAIAKEAFDLFFDGCGFDGEMKNRDKCLDLGGVSNGEKLKIWDCNNTEAQKLFYNSKDYTIRPISNSNKCLDIPNADIKVGSSIQVWDCNDTNAQKFIYDPDTKQISPVSNDSLCFELINNNNANGTEYKLAACKNSTAQQFNLKRNVIIDMGASCHVDGSRSADCPAGYTNNGLTCGRGDDTIGAGAGRPADCPSGYTNTGLTCFRGLQLKTSDFGLGAYESADCPMDYTNTGTTCHYWGTSFQRDYFSKVGASINTDLKNCENRYGSGNCEIKGVPGTRLARPKTCEIEAKYLNKSYPDKYVDDGLSTMGSRCYRHAHTMGTIGDVGVCPPSNDSKNKYTTKTGALCYVNCENEYGSGWYNNGTNCARDASSLGTSSMTCNSDEFLNTSLGRCYKICPSGYTNTGVSCYRPVDTKGFDSLTCKPWERKILGFCYPKILPGFTNGGIFQTRAKETKNVLGGIIKNKKFDQLKTNVKTLGDDFRKTFDTTV